MKYVLKTFCVRARKELQKISKVENKIKRKYQGLENFFEIFGEFSKVEKKWKEGSMESIIW